MSEVFVLGSHGRMGRLIAQEASDRLAFSYDHSMGGLGQKLDDTRPAVLIDFTVPKACAEHARLCAQYGVALLVGTTGLGPDALAAIDDASSKVPVLLASNTSLGANLLFHLTEVAAKALPQADIEIVELHHKHKRDAPSGTAKSMAEAVARTRASTMRFARVGETPRQPGEVGVFALRGGTVAGEHTAYFFLDDERVEVSHRVTDRVVFARGAVKAALFLIGQPAGHYTMRDVLGLS